MLKITTNYDTSDDEASLGWYWHDSFNEDYSDLDEELANKTQGEEEEEELIESGSQISIVESAVLRWDTKRKTKLCGI